MPDKKCSNFQYCIMVSFGYSNWAVEGTEVYCSKELNPEAPFDRWYGSDKRDSVAEKCPEYDNKDEPVYIDDDSQGYLKDNEDPRQNYTTAYVTFKQIEQVVHD